MSFDRAKLLFVPPHFPNHLASSSDSPVDFSLFCHEVLLVNLLYAVAEQKAAGANAAHAVAMDSPPLTKLRQQLTRALHVC